MKILLLSAWFPYPPINGSKIRLSNLIRQIATRHEIDLLAFARTIPVGEAQAHLPALRQFCRKVDVVPAREFNPRSWDALRGFASTRPRSLVQTYSHRMATLVADSLERNAYDVVIAFEAGAPSLVSLLASRIAGVPVVLEDIELTVLKDAFRTAGGPVSRVRHGLTWFKQARFTRRVLRSTAACIVPSEPERQNLIPLVSGPCAIEVVPNCVDLTSCAGDFGPRDPRSLVFSGSITYHPNLDAADYFLSSIYGWIKAAVPDVNVNILGSTNGVALNQLTVDTSVRFTGRIPDVRPLIARSWVSVVPLRLGAGTRVKIIESMAMGTPVVSTRKGAEGLAVTHGENILIADEPKEFADAVVHLIRDPEFRRKLAVAGLQLVSARYSSEVVGRTYRSILDRIAAAPRERHAGLQVF